MPPHVHDPGVGQDQVQQANVHEIGAHLVSEKRAAELAVGLRFFEIAFAQFPQRFRTEGTQNVRVIVAEFWR